MCTEPTDARRLLIVPVVIDILGEDAPRVLARRPGLVLVLVNVVPGPKSGDARGDSPAKGSLTAAAVAEGESSDAAIELRRCLALAAAMDIRMDARRWAEGDGVWLGEAVVGDAAAAVMTKSPMSSAGAFGSASDVGESTSISPPYTPFGGDILDRGDMGEPPAAAAAAVAMCAGLVLRRCAN